MTLRTVESHVLSLAMSLLLMCFDDPMVCDTRPMGWLGSKWLSVEELFW